MEQDFSYLFGTFVTLCKDVMNSLNSWSIIIVGFGSPLSFLLLLLLLGGGGVEI